MDYQNHYFSVNPLKIRILYFQQSLESLKNIKNISYDFIQFWHLKIVKTHHQHILVHHYWSQGEFSMNIGRKSSAKRIGNDLMIAAIGLFHSAL